MSANHWLTKVGSQCPQMWPLHQRQGRSQWGVFCTASTVDGPRGPRSDPCCWASPACARQLDPGEGVWARGGARPPPSTDPPRGGAARGGRGAYDAAGVPRAASIRWRFFLVTRRTVFRLPPLRALRVYRAAYSVRKTLEVGFGERRLPCRSLVFFPVVSRWKSTHARGGRCSPMRLLHSGLSGPSHLSGTAWRQRWGACVAALPTTPRALLPPRLVRRLNPRRVASSAQLGPGRHR